jgi:tRNA-specific 2-thiouridylase
VVGLDGYSATVIVAHPEEAVIREVNVGDVTWIRKPDRGEEVTAKVRYQMQPALCQLDGSDELHLAFDEPQKPTAPGQVAAFYSGDELLGGGIVISVV